MNVNTQTQTPETQEQLFTGVFQQSEGEKFLDDIKKSKEYKEKDDSPEKSEVYKKFFKDTIAKENLIGIHVLAGSKLPARGNMKLENYLAKIIDSSQDAKELSQKAIFLRNQKELVASKEDQNNQVDELKKLLGEKDDEIKDLKDFKQKSFFEGGLDPQKEKLNARLFSMGYKQGVLRTQMLTPAATLRRMKMNRIAKKIKAIGDKPSEGIRYISNMTSLIGGGRATASIRRGFRSIIGDARRNPEKFKANYQKKLDNFLAKPGDLQNNDEKAFAEYIQKRAIYYRDAFLREQAQRRQSSLGEKIQKPIAPYNTTFTTKFGTSSLN